jgi:hypothetical protein
MYIVKSDFTPGDCFKFKEEIEDFGLVLLEEEFYTDGQEYKLFPVRLNRGVTGLDQFRQGEVYITKFYDQLSPVGITEGFMVYFFLHEKNFESIRQFLDIVGHLSLRNEFMESTGGTSANNYADFKYQLENWSQMFGENGRLTQLSEVIYDRG